MLSFSFAGLTRGRFLFLLGLALILAAERSSNTMTMALFTSVATNANNQISTATLNLSTAVGTGTTVFTTSNMVPGDWYFNTVTINNAGGQSFTYNVSSSATVSSKLDQNSPSTAASSGAAFLIFRCTSDAAGNLAVSCASTGAIYVTQVYPSAGAGTKITMTGPLLGTSFGPVAGGAAYSVALAGTQFTGGPIVIPSTPSAFNMGGPDAVTGATDAQTKGIAVGGHDYLAALVYLPTQMDTQMAGLNSTVSYTWTATQRAGAKQ